MKEFTQEMLDTLREAHREVTGTKAYQRYVMEASFKRNDRWNFIGWGIPYLPGKFKIVKGQLYIVTDALDGQERYAVSEEVAKLLNI